MLVISAEQLKTLAATTDELFLEDAAARLAVHWPKRVERLGHEALLVRLRAVHRLALANGIKERPDLLRLANMAMAVDDDLDGEGFAWVREALADRRLRPADRLDVLDGEVRDWLLDRRTPQ